MTYRRLHTQTTVKQASSLLDIDDVVVKVATSSNAGQDGQAVGTCGALLGGTMILDYFFGRPVEKLSYQECIPANLELMWDAMEASKLLYDTYIKEYGTIICPHIQVQLFGRHYYFPDPDELEKFEKAGGHSDPDKCSHVVGNAARRVMEILLDKGAVEG